MSNKTLADAILHAKEKTVARYRKSKRSLFCCPLPFCCASPYSNREELKKLFFIDLITQLNEDNTSTKSEIELISTQSPITRDSIESLKKTSNNGHCQSSKALVIDYIVKRFDDAVYRNHSIDTITSFFENIKGIFTKNELKNDIATIDFDTIHLRIQAMVSTRSLGPTAQ